MIDKIIPIADNILVQLKEDREPGSLIIMPQTAEKEGAGVVVYGTVLKIGPSVRNCEVGDNVLFLFFNMIATFTGQVALLPAQSIYAKYIPWQPTGPVSEILCEDCGAQPGGRHELTCPAVHGKEP